MLRIGRTTVEIGLDRDISRCGRAGQAPYQNTHRDSRPHDAWLIGHDFLEYARFPRRSTIASAPQRYHSLPGPRPVAVRSYDAVLIVTDHDDVDYALLANASLVIDTRNACARRGLHLDQVVKA